MLASCRRRRRGFSPPRSGRIPSPTGWRRCRASSRSLDATRVVFDLQRQAGIDLPTDGELYRFDVNHPDTNGMIDYFVSRLGGIRVRRRAARQRGVPREDRDALPQQARRCRRRAVTEGIAEPAGRLRARRHGRGRAVQVHGHQPLHARPHAARRALSRFPGAHAGRRRRARRSGRGARVRLRASRRGEHPRESGRRAARRRSDQPRARRGPRAEGGALLFRQLRRPDDSEGNLDRADRVPQLPSRRSSGPRAGAPARRRTWRRCESWTRASASASAWWTSRSTTSRRRTKSPAPSSAPRRHSARAACDTCIPTAGSGCSNARWPTARSPRS